MELLKQKILNEGKVVSSHILKVSSFLNHQLDIELLDKMAEEVINRFVQCKITKVLTIETSGIAFACSVARLLKVPVVFAKKNKSSNVPEDVYMVSVYSFTHEKMNNIIVSKEFLSKDDKVLIVDDFLANGKALEGLFSLVDQANGDCVGATVAIEKGFQKGGDNLRAKGYRIESLVIVDSMDIGNKIIFR